MSWVNQHHIASMTKTPIFFELHSNIIVIKSLDQIKESKFNIFFVKY
jgi:hypothetical protein